MNATSLHEKYRVERDEYAKQSKLQKDAYDKKLADERKSEASNIAYQGTIKSKQDLIDSLDAQLKSSEIERDKMTRIAKAKT